jgi:hypothetical protein
MKDSPYLRFFLMLIGSGISMYITMYFNTYEIGHVFFSWTRLYMTLLGLGGMALVMFFFMKKMYTDGTKNLILITLTIGLMALSTFLVRNQIPIGDLAWMRAMIPHHSIAILTSTQADLQDPEVRKLAQEIIKAQEREIKEMKKMIDRLEEND